MSTSFDFRQFWWFSISPASNAGGTQEMREQFLPWSSHQTWKCRTGPRRISLKASPFSRCRKPAESVCGPRTPVKASTDKSRNALASSDSSERRTPSTTRDRRPHRDFRGLGNRKSLPFPELNTQKKPRQKKSPTTFTEKICATRFLPGDDPFSALASACRAVRKHLICDKSWMTIY